MSSWRYRDIALWAYCGHVTSSVMWFPVGNFLLVSFRTN